jgi:hypothetical protein
MNIRLTTGNSVFLIDKLDEEVDHGSVYVLEEDDILFVSLILIEWK